MATIRAKCDKCGGFANVCRVFANHWKQLCFKCRKVEGVQSQSIIVKSSK